MDPASVLTRYHGQPPGYDLGIGVVMCRLDDGNKLFKIGFRHKCGKDVLLRVSPGTFPEIRRLTSRLYLHAGSKVRLNQPITDNKARRKFIGSRLNLKNRRGGLLCHPSMVRRRWVLPSTSSTNSRPIRGLSGSALSHKRLGIWSLSNDRHIDQNQIFKRISDS